MNIDYDEFVKSNSKAAKLRTEGNQLYKNGKLYDALLKYNESLCNADDDVNLALAYANRSAVYFELKQHQHCLKNIQLARQHEYPTEKMSSLDDREMRCLELIMQKTEFLNDSIHFFKLSYKANPKIPFIIDGLELKTNKEFGRHIITNRTLNVGDIISIEPPFFSVLHSDPSFDKTAKPSNKFNYCHHCLMDNMMDLIPCFGCNATMYCSESCAKSALSYHQYECVMSGIFQEANFEYMPKRSFFKALSIVGGSIEELKKLYIECQRAPKTTFDFNFSNPEDADYEKNQLKAALCLAKDDSVQTFDCFYIEFEIHPLLANMWASHEKFIRQILLHLYKLQRHTISAIARWSLSTKSHETIGVGNFLFGAYLNHSCSPNVIRFAIDDKICTIVVRAIAKGEQLFDCYTHCFYEMLKKLRQASLKKYSIHCYCEACKDPRRFALLHQLEIFDEQMFMHAESASRVNYDNMDRKKIVGTIESFKTQMQNIDKNYPSREYCLLILSLHNAIISLSQRNQ